MHCPHCQQDALNPSPTTTGVELDRCQACGSIWFDRGELFFFARDAQRFEDAIDRARKVSPESAFPSPVSGAPMVELTVADALHRAYLDRQTGGVWLPGDAVDELGALLMAAVVLAIQFLIGPFLMDLTVRWMYKARRAWPGSLIWPTCSPIATTWTRTGTSGLTRSAGPGTKSGESARTRQSPT